MAVLGEVLSGVLSDAGGRARRLHQEEEAPQSVWLRGFLRALTQAVSESVIGATGRREGCPTRKKAC